MSADNISDFLIESGARLFSAIEKIKKQIAENIKKDELNNIKFLEEKKSLGTAGSLFMIKKKFPSISLYLIQILYLILI